MPSSRSRLFKMHDQKLVIKITSGHGFESGRQQKTFLVNNLLASAVEFRRDFLQVEPLPNNNQTQLFSSKMIILIYK